MSDGVNGNRFELVGLTASSFKPTSLAGFKYSDFGPRVGGIFSWTWFKTPQ